MRILVVDDDPALRELLRVTFEESDVAVDEAASAEEALSAIGRELPDVVVLDLRLPAMDGASLCRRLRREKRTWALPVILLTGANGDQLAAAYECGANAVVRKPFSPLELLALVEQLAGLERGMSGPFGLVSSGGEELLLYARDLRRLIEVERSQRAALQDAYHATVEALANALETKDVHTKLHSQRVQRCATLLLDAIDPACLDRNRSIEYGFLLHDVGKIGIPITILHKPDPLTAEERRVMQQHTVLGERLLRGIPFLEGDALRVVRSHHERWDGGGYPDGLRGPDTALPARVFAVADALDAMTSDRPYRRALSWDAARDEIITQSGRQFDPDVVEAFLDWGSDLQDLLRDLAAA